MRRLPQIVAYACAVVTPSALMGIASAEPVVATTTGGQTVAGEIVSWSTERLEITVGGSPQAFTAAELLGVRPQRAASPAIKFTPFIELADESTVPIHDFTVNARVAMVPTPLSRESLKVPADLIRLVKWVDVEVELPPPEATGDCLAVLKKDSVTTEVLTGVIGEISAEQVEFTWEGETLPVRRSKIAALSFFRKAAGASTPKPLCYLTMASGARLAVKELALGGESLEVATVTGLELRVPLVELVEADYSAGKLTYLSDMRPLQSTWTPLIEIPTAAESIRNFGLPRMNVAFTGSPLRLSWPGKDGGSHRLDTYGKGLALRSRTELEYRLPRGMHRFVAIAGIDPETLTQGDVWLRIEADDDAVFESAISGQDPPMEIDANIAGKEKLRIFVDYGGNLDLGDRLHLVEARLVK